MIKLKYKVLRYLQMEKFTKFVYEFYCVLSRLIIYYVNGTQAYNCLI